VQVVAVVYDDGSCALWDFYQRLQVAVLELPPELQGGKISRLVFQPPPSTVFHTAVNAHNKGYLVRWDQDRMGNVHAKAFKKVHNTSITAMAVSRSGAYLGTGTSDGDFLSHLCPGCVEMLECCQMRAITCQVHVTQIVLLSLLWSGVES